ncbi:MAG TPA: hypothetical protein CFH84_04625 [Sulfurimonas sp. UBA12504]|nr:MAG: hypothetical protein A2019_09710 [Sulfurimonas sp. GWF2_37_8]DAB30338.1 MAG TPA: hypothetical protein CFH84_04625 [Sulfurimonas sp. UBA12504]
MKKLKISGCKVINQILIFSIQFLKRKQLKVIEKFGTSLINNPDKYESLIPNENADIGNQYSDMLQVALETPKNNNIAVTGTYGSGKSSFLRTFEKKHKEWEYLHISLATFEDLEKEIENLKPEPIQQTQGKEGQPTLEDRIKPKQDKLNQILEKSILQQIFYKEKDKTIPFSRFKRINNIKKSSLILHSFFIGMLLLYSLAIFLPEKVHQFLMCNLKEQILEYPFISWIVFLILGFYFYKIFQFFMKLQVSKFNIKSGEIEVNNRDKTSILNEHLDEILYFFEVTSYDVVVIEDLDRFGNTEIFIKLRELNTLISNSKDINRRVRFVYAIKDDMFKDKDRTKFFDFIIPIIPYINSSSSFQKIKEKFENQEIDIEFLRNLSLRIDDMRLLINIANEYKIYKHKIGSERLNKERLLAMIVYKNFYPSDFAELHVNQGNVYDIFNQKAKFINDELAKNKELQLNKSKEISELEYKISLEKQKSIEELRMVYILKIFEKINLNHFYISNTQYLLNNINNLIRDDVFEIIKESEFKNHNSSYYNAVTSFKKIEDEVNELTYDERKKLIIEHPNQQLEQLKINLRSLENNANKIKKYEINQIAKLENSTIFEKIEKESLLKFLIRDGFIREDYYDYISYFFSGSLTLKDKDYVLSVKDDKPLEFEYSLTNIDEIIKNLTTRGFESKAVLNFSLLDYMIEKNIRDEKFDSFMYNLTDNSSSSKKFILSFILLTKEQKKFINLIAKTFKNIWPYIFKESQLTLETQKEYFQIFLKTLDKEALLSLNVDDSIKVFIEENSYIPQHNSDNDKFEYLLSTLSVKYKKFNPDYLQNSDSLIATYIFDNMLFEINQKMIEHYIEHLHLGDEIKNELSTSNYTTINQHANELLKYINSDINTYIKNVFLKIPSNTHESEEVIVNLLNNQDLDLQYKLEIIKKEETKINDIATLPSDLWLDVLRENKLIAIWDNLLHFHKSKDELDDVLINFLNQHDNYKKLGEQKMDNETLFGKELLQKFSRVLLKESRVIDEAYSYLIQSIIWRFTDLNMDLLSSAKVEMILNHKKISLNATTLNSLKKNYPEKQIILIENFKDEFFKTHNELPLDENNYIQILKSEKFINEEKISLIETMDFILLESEELVHKIIAFYINIDDKISEDLFDKLFEASDRDNALKILTKQIPQLDDSKISSYLNQFEGQVCRVNRSK